MSMEGRTGKFLQNNSRHSSTIVGRKVGAIVAISLLLISAVPLTFRVNADMPLQAYGASDIAKPLVSIEKPASESVLTAGTITASGKASDNNGGSGVQTVEISLDGGPYKAAKPKAPGDWSTWSVSFSLSKAGTHEFKAKATDRAGNKDWDVVAFSVKAPSTGGSPDTADPKIAITYPADGKTVAATRSITIKGTASDSGSGIQAVHVRLVDNPYVAATPKAAGDWSTWSATFSITPGQHRFIARATDKAGNQEWYNLDITVNGSTPPPTSDTTLPVVSITSPANGASVSTSSVGVTGTATDNVGVSAISYAIDGGSQTPTSLSGNAFAFTLTLQQGSHTVTVRAMDGAGNSRTATVSFTITGNNPPPPLGSEDKFGVAVIYPSSTERPDSWFMDMNNPNVNRKRFDVREDSSITKNADGSWKIRDTQIRMNLYNKNGYTQSKIPTYDRAVLTQKGYMQDADDWKNVELTMFVKLNSRSGSVYFSPYARSGWHGHGTAANGDNLECEGTGVKPRIYNNGEVAEVKEMWHNDGYAVRGRHDVTGDLQGRWIGIKTVIYDVELSGGKIGVKQELWINEGGDPGVRSNWKKVVDGIDLGGFGAGGDSIDCPNSRPDQPIFWGGPVVTYRWDNANDVDFKWLSAREIRPPT